MGDLKDFQPKRTQLKKLLPLLKIIWIRIIWEPIPLVTFTPIKSWRVMPGWMYNGSIKINKKNVQHSTITHNFLRFDHPKKHRNKKSSLLKTKKPKKKKKKKKKS